jgi:hypothetical protein
MTRLVSHAYRPHPGEDSRLKEMESLRRGLALILRNLDRILRTPRFFFCQLQSAHSWTFWFGPSGPIPLGVLVLLWEDGKMIHGCPECGGGSFSGGDIWGLCADCGYTVVWGQVCTIYYRARGSFSRRATRVGSPERVQVEKRGPSARDGEHARGVR